MQHDPTNRIGRTTAVILQQSEISVAVVTTSCLNAESKSRNACNGSWCCRITSARAMNMGWRTVAVLLNEVELLLIGAERRQTLFRRGISSSAISSALRAKHK
jgi:hypothetical protein